MEGLVEPFQFRIGFCQHRGIVRILKKGKIPDAYWEQIESYSHFQAVLITV